MDLWRSNKNEVLQLVMNGVERRKRGKSGKHLMVERASKGCDRSKKKAFKLWGTNRSTESKTNYRKVRNETKKGIVEAMKQEAEEEMNVLCIKAFKFVKVIRKEEGT